MDRQGTERVFQLVADLRGDLRDRLAHERWWLVWIVMGFQVPATNAVTHLLVACGETRLWPFALLWGAQVALLALTIRFVHRRSGGRRSQREAFVWWIWTAFLLAACAAAALNALLGLPVFFTAPVIALLAAYAFAMMAMAVHVAFLAASGLFAATFVAMSLLPRVQFLIYGGAWFFALQALGLYFRPRSGGQARAL